MKEQLEKLEKEAKDTIAKLQDALLEIEALKNEKPNLKSGWYKHENDRHPKWLMYLNSDNSVFGFDVYGDWITDCNLRSYMQDQGRCVPATSKEVEEHLIAEAKKRGFKEGVKCNALGQETLCKEGFAFYVKDPIHNCECLYAANLDCGGALIYKNGLWATIQKEDKLFLDKEQKYEIKFHGLGCPFPYITIDGNEFGDDFFKAAALILDNSKASVLLGCDAKTKGSHSWILTKELNDKILEKLK